MAESKKLIENISLKLLMGKPLRRNHKRRSWIRASWYNYESNQQDATI